MIPELARAIGVWPTMSKVHLKMKHRGIILPGKPSHETSCLFLKGDVYDSI